MADTAKYHALRCGPWCEGHKADAVAWKMIADMRGVYAPATINRSIGALKTATKLAYQAGVIPEDFGVKVTRLPENNQRHTYLTVEQVRAVADCCSEQVRAAVWIALLTGCRRGEILQIQSSDIVEDKIRVRAGNTKTLRERSVPIIPALRPWLAFFPLQINLAMSLLNSGLHCCQRNQ